jgi:DNA-binding CsgD family transcriptional regulator
VLVVASAIGVLAVDQARLVRVQLQAHFAPLGNGGEYLLSLGLARTMHRYDRVRARAMMTRALVPDLPITDARAEIGHAFQLLQGVGDQRTAAATCAVVAALLALADGDRAGAAAWFVRCLDIGIGIGYWHAVAWSVMGATGLAARTGRLAEGARLHGAMHPHLDVLRKETPPTQFAVYQRMVDILREGLGADFEYERLRGELGGWAMAIDDVRRVTTALIPGGNDQPDRAAPRRRGPRANTDLTEREFDVLRRLVDDDTNQGIADRLGVSPKTVMHHTGSVYRKLGVRGRAEAVAHAVRAGLVTAS